jgi:DNA primase large subunit
LVRIYVQLEADELRIINIATEYHIEESYPSLGRSLPIRDEIKEVLDFTEDLFKRVCYKLKIDFSEIVKN